MTRRQKLQNELYYDLKAKFDPEYFKQDEEIIDVLLTVAKKVSTFLNRNAQYISDRNFRRQRREYFRPLRPR